MRLKKKQILRKSHLILYIGEMLVGTLVLNNEDYEVVRGVLVEGFRREGRGVLVEEPCPKCSEDPSRWVTEKCPECDGHQVVKVVDVLPKKEEVI